MSIYSSRQSSPISSSAIAILRALGVGPPYSVIILSNLPSEPAFQNVGTILSDRQRGRAAHAPRRRRQLGEHPLHRDFAEFRVGDRHHCVARREMRIGEHILGTENAAGGEAGLALSGSQLLDRTRLGPFADQRVAALPPPL